MSDTVLYIAAFVIIIHFILGFVYLVRKLSGPLPDDAAGKEQESSDGGQD